LHRAISEEAGAVKREMRRMKIFSGFSLPTYTQVPDELFDILLPDLSEAELKVLLYIIRRTLGFKKNEDRISISQLEKGNGHDRGCGLKRRAIIYALKGLEAKRCILVHRRKDRQGASEVNLYSLNFSNGRVVHEMHQGSAGICTTGSALSGKRGSASGCTQQQTVYSQQTAVEPSAATFETEKERPSREILRAISQSIDDLSGITGFDPIAYVKAHVKAGIPPEVTLYVIREFAVYKDKITNFWAYGQTVLKRYWPEHTYQKALESHYKLKHSTVGIGNLLSAKGMLP
jgi:Bacteriophage replication protein O